MMSQICRCEIVYTISLKVFIEKGQLRTDRWKPIWGRQAPRGVPGCRHFYVVWGRAIA
jgi:hypothetical protein